MIATKTESIETYLKLITINRNDDEDNILELSFNCNSINKCFYHNLYGYVDKFDDSFFLSIFMNEGYETPETMEHKSEKEAVDHIYKIMTKEVERYFNDHRPKSETI